MLKAHFRLRDSLLTASVSALLTLPAGADESVYLHVIPVISPDVPSANDSPPSVILEVKDSSAILAEIPSAEVQSETRVLINLARFSEVSDPPEEAHLRPSFLVDYDEPDVEKLSRQLATELGSEPSLEELTHFTWQAIPDKTLGRGWDLASRVATHGEGDCTEHAVLLAALARAAGHPARVVVGTAVVDFGNRYEAYGHAWAEIYDGRQWQRADATEINKDLPVYYLPQHRVRNEGPGYALALMGSLQSTHPRTVEIVQAKP